MSNPLLPWRITHCGPSVHIFSADGHEIAEVVWRHEDPSKDEVAALVIEAAWLAHEVGPKVTALIEAAERAKEALQFYGRHLSTCDMRTAHWITDEPPCTCGLEADIVTLQDGLTPFQPPPPGPLPVEATQPAADPSVAGADPGHAPASAPACEDPDVMAQRLRLAGLLERGEL